MSILRRNTHLFATEVGGENIVELLPDERDITATLIAENRSGKGFTLSDVGRMMHC